MLFRAHKCVLREVVFAATIRTLYVLPLPGREGTRGLGRGGGGTCKGRVAPVPTIIDHAPQWSMAMRNGNEG
eukprot:7391565-Prymnesium_polylepis.1